MTEQVISAVAGMVIIVVVIHYISVARAGRLLARQAKIASLHARNTNSVVYKDLEEAIENFHSEDSWSLKRKPHRRPDGYRGGLSFSV